MSKILNKTMGAFGLLNQYLLVTTAHVNQVGKHVDNSHKIPVILRRACQSTKSVQLTIYK
jgi:hypothetical protein